MSRFYKEKSFFDKPVHSTKNRSWYKVCVLILLTIIAAGILI
jgi:hypothetical protein